MMRVNIGCHRGMLKEMQNDSNPNRNNFYKLKSGFCSFTLEFNKHFERLLHVKGHAVHLLSETGVITVTGTDGGVCKWEDRNQFSNDTDCTKVHLL